MDVWPFHRLEGQKDRANKTNVLPSTPHHLIWGWRQALRIQCFQHRHFSNLSSKLPSWLWVDLARAFLSLRGGGLAYFTGFLDQIESISRPKFGKVCLIFLGANGKHGVYTDKSKEHIYFPTRQCRKALLCKEQPRRKSFELWISQQQCVDPTKKWIAKRRQKSVYCWAPRLTKNLHNVRVAIISENGGIHSAKNLGAIPFLFASTEYIFGPIPISLDVVEFAGKLEGISPLDFSFNDVVAQHR